LACHVVESIFRILCFKTKQGINIVQTERVDVRELGLCIQLVITIDNTLHDTTRSAVV
jgi:hypothetical protein